MTLDVISGMAAVPVGESAMGLYVVRPDNEPRGAVLVLQEAFGVNRYIQDVAAQLASAGYLAVAPDLFHRAQQVPRSYADRELAMATIGAITREQIVEDLSAALGWVTDQGIGRERTAVLGFCFGGRAAFSGAVSGLGVVGTIVFYGPGFSQPDLVTRVSDIDAPVLLVNGADDPTISREDIATVTSALDLAGVRYKSHVYSGAGHAFHCHARPNLFNATAAADAWGRTQDFLADLIR